MGLKAVVSKIEDIPEGFRGLYKQADGGKLVLDVEPVEGFALEDVGGLKSALSGEREAKRAAEAKLTELSGSLKSFEGLDPAETRKKLTKLDELLKIDPEKEADRLARERVEGWIAGEGKKYQGEIEKREQRIASLSSALSKEMIEAKAVTAITSEKGRIKPLMPHVLARTRIREIDGQHVAEVLDEKGNPRIGSADGKPMTISELVRELKADPDFAGNFEGSGHSGSGSHGGSGHPGSGGAQPTKSVDMIRSGLQSRMAPG